MFRCPCCARSAKLALTNGYSLLMSKSMQELYIVKEPIKLTSSFIRVEVDISKVAEALEREGMEFDFHPEHENKLKCTVCSTWNNFSDWVNAWTTPGDYFDADSICSCGGELWYDNIRGTSQYGLVCEKCEWVKPRSVISGSQFTHN